MLVDASSEPDLYAAFLLAGVLDTGCLIDAGDRGKPLPAASRTLLETGALNDGYAIGGTAAVPPAKLAGNLTWRRAPGADRWATLQLIGNNAADPTGLPAASDGATFTTDSQGSAASECGGDTAAVLADASSDPDWFAAFLLAGVLDTGCLIDAGDRGKPLPAASRTLLETGTLNNGYAIGGTAAVPPAKLAGNLAWRRAPGADRWATLQLIGNNAADPTGLPKANAAATPEPARATRLTNNDTIDSEPTWSPDGQHIAFTSWRPVGNASNTDIYVISADGTNQTRLTNNDTIVSEPVWSPDGQHIAFTSWRDENKEIYVMDADGTNRTRLTNNDTPDRSHVWSPDGQHIAFTSWRDGNQEIYVMDADGTNQTRLTSNDDDDRAPVWSPDGQHIAFTSRRDGNQEIYVMDADGTNQTRLTTNDTPDSEPIWSPDGQHIAFTSWHGGNQEIYVMDADGTNQTRLTNNDDDDRAPVWSPDGQHIAFTSRRDGNQEIYVMDADGTNQTRLTNNDTPDSEPIWSPDGQHIAFTSRRDGNQEIYVMSIAGEPRS